MDRSARLLIIEGLHHAGQTLPIWAAAVGLAIVAQRGGQSRTESQMRKLLASAGFRISEIKRLGPSRVIEAIHDQVGSSCAER